MKIDQFGYKLFFFLAAEFFCFSHLFAKEIVFSCNKAGIPLAANAKYKCDDAGKIYYEKNDLRGLELFSLNPPAAEKVSSRLLKVSACRTTKDLFHNDFYDFDSEGNFYFVANGDFHPLYAFDDIKNVTYIYKFNPVDESVLWFRMNENSVPNSFCISNDGKWIFLDTLECTDSYKEIYCSRVYAISTNFDSEPTLLYSSEPTTSINHLIVNICFFQAQKMLCISTVDGKIYSVVSDAAGNYTDKTLITMNESSKAYKIFANKEGLWGITSADENNKVSSIVHLVNEQGMLLDAKDNLLKKNVMGNWKYNPHVVVESDSILFVSESGAKIYNYSNKKMHNVSGLAISKRNYNYDDLEEVASILENKQNENLNIIKLKNQITLFTILLIFSAIVILVLLIYIFYLNNKSNIIKKDKQFIFNIQEAERGKISRDIHDSVIQDIRAIRIESDLLQVDGENAVHQNKIINIATDCVVKLRNICYNLTPAELATHNEGDSSKIELISIIQSLVVQFIERTHVPCQLKINEKFNYPIIEKEKSQNLFRIIQEALNNIEKHSYATSCQILIQNKVEGDKTYMIIYISDDGVGCDTSQLLKRRNRLHFGIRNMMDRAELIGAKIDFNSESGQGLEVKIQLRVD
ncbi:MAG: histidine kinase [Treponema sp.]|nr:histidine kinase [Treponema sp.]